MASSAGGDFCDCFAAAHGRILLANAALRHWSTDTRFSVEVVRISAAGHMVWPVGCAADRRGSRRAPLNQLAQWATSTACPTSANAGRRRDPQLRRGHRRHAVACRAGCGDCRPRPRSGRGRSDPGHRRVTQAPLALPGRGKRGGARVLTLVSWRAHSRSMRCSCTPRTSARTCRRRRKACADAGRCRHQDAGTSEDATMKKTPVRPAAGQPRRGPRRMLRPAALPAASARSMIERGRHPRACASALA